MLMLGKVRASLRAIGETGREEAALRKRHQEAIWVWEGRVRPIVMVVDRASMRGRYIERHMDRDQALARARAITAGASDDVAFVVIANIDGSGPLDPESTYRVLRHRGLI
jgi:hypothetical protein